MYRQRTYHRNRIAKYFRRTWKTKLGLIAVFILTYVGAKLTGDGTGFVLALMFGIPMFFSRSDYSRN